MNTIIVETSARHIHLTEEHIEILFGKGHKLTNKKDLSQPGEFACEERVNIIGPKREIKNVIILGPARKATQVEVSLTEARTLGIEVPIRESGDVAGSAPCKLVGPVGSVEISEGVIAAKRHIHLRPQDAEKFGVKDKQIVQVKVKSERTTIFDDVVIRVRDTFMPYMHIDTDEANACAASGNIEGEILTTTGLQMHFGLDLISDGNWINEILSKKIKDLREQLKADLNIDMPTILIRDNLEISKTEVVFYDNGVTKWRKDFNEADKNNFEEISDVIISKIKELYV